MKLKMFAGAALAVAAMAITGCTTVPGVVMDKSKPIEQGGYSVVGSEVSATETQIYVFGYGLSDFRGSAGRRMYKNALGQAPGSDALIEYTTDTRSLNLGPVQIIWYTVTGTPVRTNAR